METLNKLKIVIAILIVILCLVVLRLTGSNFKPDAQKRIAPSLDGKNIVTNEQVADMGGNKLLINLGSLDISYPNIRNIENIEPGSIIKKEIIRKIRRNKGPVLLYSDNGSVSAATWMVLAQIGLTNIYILSETRNNEFIKYEFRPDTLSRQESLIF